MTDNTNKGFWERMAKIYTAEDEKFDVVVIANDLHIMPQPGKALKEIHRVFTELLNKEDKNNTADAKRLE